jgi:hypothetical protein
MGRRPHRLRPGCPVSAAPERGLRGEKGDRGERGTAVLPPRVRKALVVLFLLPSLIALAAVAGVVIQTHDLIVQTHSFQAGLARERAAQARQGQALGAKLCRTFATLAALRPPPGSPASNPSRAYLQGLHARLDELGRDLGCPER